MYPNGIAIPSKEVQLLLGGHRIGCDEQIHNGFPGFPKKYVLYFKILGGFRVCVVNGQMVLTFKMRLYPTGLAELTKKRDHKGGGEIAFCSEPCTKITKHFYR